MDRIPLVSYTTTNASAFDLLNTKGTKLVFSAPVKEFIHDAFKPYIAPARPPPAIVASILCDRRMDEATTPPGHQITGHAALDGVFVQRVLTAARRLTDGSAAADREEVEVDTGMMVDYCNRVVAEVYTGKYRLTGKQAAGGSEARFPGNVPRADNTELPTAKKAGHTALTNAVRTPLPWMESPNRFPTPAVEPQAPLPATTPHPAKPIQSQAAASFPTTGRAIPFSAAAAASSSTPLPATTHSANPLPHQAAASFSTTGRGIPFSATAASSSTPLLTTTPAHLGEQTRPTGMKRRLINAIIFNTSSDYHYHTFDIPDQR